VGLVAGVLVVNLALLAVGYALLAVALRGARLRVWISYGGVALATGAALVPVALCVVAVAGGRTNPAAFGAVAATLAVLGLALATLLPARRRALIAVRPRPAPAEGRLADVVAGAAGAALVAILIAVLIGGFRTTPWLDDSWFQWLPKGMALDRLGLDARLFAPSGPFRTFANPDYPWWWSIVTDLDVRAVGAVDLRALNGQLGVLLTAFVAATMRLLWGRVRPSLLCCGMLLLVAAPELLRQTQGGGADVPVALFVGLTAVAVFVWLRDGELLALALVAVFASAAIQIKDEGLPQIAILFAAATVVAWGSAGPRRIGLLWLAGTTALSAALPWLVWRRLHDVPSELSLGDGLHRLTAFDAGNRLHDAVVRLVHDAFAPRQWLVIVPLALVLSVGAALAGRRLLPLAVGLVLAIELLFWSWVYWSTASDADLQYRLTTSAYRVVVTPIVLAGLALPLLLEAIAGAARARRPLLQGRHPAKIA
jgi:hypothetical protein